MNDAQNAPELPKVRVVFGNETSRRVQLWLEPFCHYAHLDPKHKIDFRASLLGDRECTPSDLAAAFEKIVGSRGPELEIYLSEDKDGSLVLTLWLDHTDEIGCGEKDPQPMRSS
jgi:hypothetical protein